MLYQCWYLLRGRGRIAFRPANLRIVQALNGAGDTASPSLMNFVCFWLVQIPLALYLATGTPLQSNGAFAAIVISESLLTILSAIVFRRGQWKSHVA